MKQIEKIAAGANFNAVSVGKSDELNDYVMELGSGVKIPGKVFGRHSRTSHRQRILFPIVHARNGKRFPAYPPKSRGTLLLPQRVGRIPGGRAGLPVSEGSVVRVAPAGKRSVRNNGTRPLVMLCVQYKSGTFTAEDAADGIILQEPVQW